MVSHYILSKWTGSILGLLSDIGKLAGWEKKRIEVGETR
jgi:hypothetical protein